MIEWKKIDGFPNYSVSNTGLIKNDRTGTIQKQFIRGSYLKVVLFPNRKNVSVHRCVATAFVKRPTNTIEVNHIDGDKQNNNAENLEWVTPSENHIHRVNVLKRGYFGKEVYCVETNTVYRSAAEAQRRTGVCSHNISKCIHGERERAGGYHWRRFLGGN